MYTLLLLEERRRATASEVRNPSSEKKNLKKSFHLFTIQKKVLSLHIVPKEPPVSFSERNG